ncbi:microtubule-associated protein 6 homolog isoform X1 [Astyanax mexicanus]|uniref:Microtubule-associated protein 6b n=1 Tax=Astyanax mexicanus TaxID=7994 RepID=A0A3B1J109_ASTMX|nr:microtubule-associated protein 6 homolog isoform X1 [Astyanax mexicanus]
MAWPCIARACCMSRLWSELDKADIAVPLVFSSSYSEVADGQQAGGGAAEARRDGAAPGVSSSVMHEDFRAWRVRPEKSCKPKHEYRPSGAPFTDQTQYQKDYKPWPIPRKGDHPWIPKGANPPGKREPEERETGVEKCEIEERVQEKESKERRKKSRKEKEPASLEEKSVKQQVKEEVVKKQQVKEEVVKKEEEGEAKARSAVDALNRQIKQEVTSGSSYRTEFKAYSNVKPVKPIKAKSQYKLLVEEKASLETSYSATFKGEQVKPQPTDNKVMERRRIRSLYSEPSSKEPIKVERSSASHSRPKKTTSHSKTASKAKAKQITATQPAKKKTSVSNLELNPEGGVTKKSKEIINRLAEGKD